MADAWGGSWGSSWANTWGGTGGVAQATHYPAVGGGIWPEYWNKKWKRIEALPPHEQIAELAAHTVEPPPADVPKETLERIARLLTPDAPPLSQRNDVAATWAQLRRAAEELQRKRDEEDEEEAVALLLLH